MNDVCETSFVILGMHRSGTSALTRAISMIGPQLPKKLMQANQFNAPGYWEPSTIVDMNDEILNAAQRHWADPKPMPETWQHDESFTAFRGKALNVLEDVFDHNGSIVLKDPRMSRVLPVWHDALRTRDARPAYVIMCRNPLEVAASLATRDKMSTEHALHLWATYMLEAEYNSRGADRAVVMYDDLLQDWRQALTPILPFTGLACFEDADSSVTAEIDGFLSPEHRHHRSSARTLEEDTEVPDLVAHIYRLFTQMPQQGTIAEFDQVREKWQAFWVKASPGQGRSAYVDQLPQVKVEQSEALENSGEIDAALDLMKQAAALLTEDVLCQFRFGRLLEQAGKQVGAEAAYRRSLAINPKMAGASMGLARLLEQRGLRGEALAELQAAQALNAEIAAFDVQIGRLYELSDDFDSAAKAFAAGFAKNPEMIVACQGLARVREAQGDPVAAADILQEVRTAHPEKAVLHFNYGQVMERQGLMAEATAAFGKALAAEGRHPGMVLALVKLLKAQDAAETLMAVLQDGHEQFPDNAAIAFQLALALEASGGLEAATGKFRTALGLPGQNAPMHMGLVRVLMAQGQFSAAREAACVARDTHAADAAIALQHGNLLEQIGKLEDALDAFHHAVACGETGVAAAMAIARLMRKQRDYAGAQEALDAAIIRHPEHAALMFERGLLGEQSSNLNGACLAMQKAVSLVPDHSGYRVALARVLVKMGEPEDAQAVLKAGLERVTQQAELTAELATLKELEGQFDEAEKLRRQVALADKNRIAQLVDGSGPASGMIDPEVKIALLRYLAWQAAGAFATDAVQLNDGERPVTVGEQRWPLGSATPEAVSAPSIAPVDKGAERPLLSVMIPTYRVTSEAWLRQCIDSILAQGIDQTYVQIGILDDSPDHPCAQEVARSYGDQVEYLPNPDWLGLSGNFNRCIEAAKGEFVHILHQDDWIAPGFYDALLTPLRSDPGIVAAFARTEFVDEHDRTKSIDPQYSQTAGVLPGWLEMLAFRLRLWCPAVVVRRAAYERIGGFSPTLTLAMDWDMWVRLSALGPVWYEPTSLSRFRSHVGSETWQQLPVDRTIDLMRTMLRNLSYVPEDKRYQMAQAAFYYDLMNASRQVLPPDGDAFPEDTRQRLFRLLLRTASSKLYADKLKLAFGVD